uniref:Uncharacterized protein n=1 Tax=Tanacetum cinerariifolium TaxID=118510 RepID=A0A699H2A6_TANCI|nr:hypothetical protein [Tanacetum cinerariifolium]
MRELIVKYKAEKVCHEEMVKMPLVDLKVLEVRGETNKCECEVYTKSKEEYELNLKMNLELLKKEKCYVETSKAEDASTEMLRDLDQLVERKDIAGGVNEAVARHGVHVSSIPDSDGMYIESERTFWMLETMFKACVRNLVVVGILTFRADEIGESKMIGLELEQEMTKVVVIKERLKEAKDRQES